MTQPLFHYLLTNDPYAVKQGATCPDLFLCSSKEEVAQKGRKYWDEWVETVLDDYECKEDWEDDGDDPAKYRVEA